MATPAPLSIPSTLDLFAVPGIQYAIQANLITEHRPISTINSESAITFVFSTANDEYLQLKDLLLRLKLRVNLKKTGGTNPTTTEWTEVSPVNYLLHSLFKQVILTINGKIVTVAPQTYAYKAMLESIFGFSEDARKSHLTSALYSADSSTSPDEKNAVRNKYINPGSTTDQGKIVELIGKPHLDLSFQEKALIGGLNIKLEFIPHDPKFYLIADTDKVLPSVEFLDASLFVHRSKVSPLIVQAHERTLQKSNAKYPVCRSEVKTFTVNSGTFSANIDNIVSGQLPRRALVAIVSNSAFNGDYGKNPYNFKNYKVNYITSHIDGLQYPAVPYTPDFTSGAVTREYIGFFEALGQLSTDSVISLSRDDWINGKTIFGFNYAPDFANGCIQEGHTSPFKRGTMGLQLKFTESLSEAINVLVYLEYDNLVQIDSEKNVVTDFI